MYILDKIEKKKLVCVVVIDDLIFLNNLYGVVHEWEREYGKKMFFLMNL